MREWCIGEGSGNSRPRLEVPQLQERNYSFDSQVISILLKARSRDERATNRKLGRRQQTAIPFLPNERPPKLEDKTTNGVVAQAQQAARLQCYPHR